VPISQVLKLLAAPLAEDGIEALAPQEVPMLRPLTLQPLSLVLGVVFALACFMAMGQSPVCSGTATAPIRIEYLPHPRDMVQIREGTPFTVPPGRLFVLTALGTADASAGAGVSTWLKMNGQNEAQAVSDFMNTGQANNPSCSQITPMPAGFTAGPGSILEVVSNSGSMGRVWGYLAPQ
jgi:hypothetical protein